MIRRFAVMLCVSLLAAACSAAPPVQPAVRSAFSTMPFGVGGRMQNLPPKIKYFQVPTLGSWPENITVGPDGALWFTEYYQKQIGRITTSGKATEFQMPYPDDVEAIATGSDGNLWITEPGANNIGRLTPGGVETDFPIPALDPGPREIALGPDGAMWFTENNDDHIGRITTAGVITRFALPTNSSPWGIVAGSDGLIYVADTITSEISRFNPSTSQFLSPVKLQQAVSPWALCVGPDKNVWFTESRSGKIGVIVNGKVSALFKIPARGPDPRTIATGPDGNLWIGDASVDEYRNSIAAFNPTTQQFLPLIFVDKHIPESIVAGPDSNMWFASAGYGPNSDRIGVVLLH